MTALAGTGAAATILNASWHFVRFDREEVGDFDVALAQMRPRARVCALIFDRDSRIANFSPFLHFGSYYQAQKGGVVEFSFAGYTHWPFDFKPARYPPPGGPAGPRSEWQPQLAAGEDLHAYYDYVLTRGDGFTPAEGTFRLKWRGQRWAVWER